MIPRGTLIVARHHESEWNRKGLWTGTRDVHLTQHGFEKSGEMGLLIQDIPIQHAFASMQVRAIETLSCMLSSLRLFDVPLEYSAMLNERDYGDYTGKNKWDMEKLIGPEKFELMRRGWDYPIPNGETLEMVYERVVPFYKQHILPLLLAGENVLMVSHGNAIRALMMYIEQVPHTNEGAEHEEMLFGAVVLYHVDAEGKILDKEERAVESEVHA
jgi:2,3-bisphosphoglycerate-dependent phosphoglycerate mutase